MVGHLSTSYLFFGISQYIDYPGKGGGRFSFLRLAFRTLQLVESFFDSRLDPKETQRLQRAFLGIGVPPFYI